VATDLLGELAGRITACRACPRLVEWRESVASSAPAAFAGQHYWARPLAGTGDPEARLVVVGLAPAAHGGNRTGRMFTGDRSGDFLVAGLHRAGFANQPVSTSVDDGLVLADAWLTAPVRCAPPDNRPLPAERDACLAFLAEELGLLGRARVYLALGSFAYDALRRVAGTIGTPPAPRPKFGHGVVVGLSSGRSIVCSYHPSQRNVFTGLLDASMFDAVLATAKALLSSSGAEDGDSPRAG
jgi:uracil-DNA glycosylase family 4